jgi:hypothetical protein
VKAAPWAFEQICQQVHDAGAATTDAVLRATGHEPRSFADYLADPTTLAAWDMAAHAS